MTSIVTLTDAAIAHIKNMMNKDHKTIGFRLSIKKTGCSGYAYVPQLIEQVSASDIYFMAQDHLPVYIDQEAQAMIAGLVIDYVEEDMGALGIKQKRLVFINPNEKNRCGCGESFTIE